jgi:membrane associated rhomboid family serine protease
MISNEFYKKILHITLGPLLFISVLWIVQIVNALAFNQGLAVFGIYPRTLHGLIGIFFAPFLHGSYAHLIGNSSMLLLLSVIICFNDIKLWIKSMLFGTFVGGLITWLVGFPSYHIGASILVFSLLGTILGIAIFHKKIFFIIATFFLLSLYGLSMFSGLIPQHGISFAGHLGGLLSGFACARQLRYNKT